MRLHFGERQNAFDLRAVEVREADVAHAAFAMEALERSPCLHVVDVGVQRLSVRVAWRVHRHAVRFSWRLILHEQFSESMRRELLSFVDKMKTSNAVGQ